MWCSLSQTRKPVITKIRPLEPIVVFVGTSGIPGRVSNDSTVLTGGLKVQLAHLGPLSGTRIGVPAWKPRTTVEKPGRNKRS